MDTQNFQDMGYSPAQNLLHDFQAGEFARPSLLSSVAVIETAAAHKPPLYIPSLRHISTRQLYYISKSGFGSPDTALTSDLSLAVSFYTQIDCESFLQSFRAENRQFNYTHVGVVKISAGAQS